MVWFAQNLGRQAIVFTCIVCGLLAGLGGMVIVDTQKQLTLAEDSERLRDLETKLRALDFMLLRARYTEKEYVIDRSAARDTAQQSQRKRVVEVVGQLDGRTGAAVAAGQIATIKFGIEQYFSRWDQFVAQHKGRATAEAIADPNLTKMAGSFRDIYNPMKVVLDKAIEAASTAATSRRQELNAFSARMRAEIVLGIAGISFLVLAGLFAAHRRMVKPLRRLSQAIRDVEARRLTSGMSEAARRDEIGDLARAVITMDRNLEENARLAADQAIQAEAADERRKQALIDMAETVERETAAAVDRIQATTRQVDESAHDMAQVANAVSLDTQSVSAASDQARATVEAVSAAAMRLSSSIGEITTQVTRASEVTRHAVESGAKAEATIRSLTEVVEKISAVTKLIGDIADQTNLLALNATIEAARAGEAGKGFAVVAAEVKNLASQTARSTGEINLQVAGIQAATDAAVAAVGEIGQRIREIDGVAALIATAMVEQGAATEEIARNVAQTSEASQEVSSKIDNVNHGVDQVGTRAGEVREAAAVVLQNIAGLQEVLVRAIRASTQDDDRHSASRVAVRG